MLLFFIGSPFRCFQSPVRRHAKSSRTAPPATSQNEIAEIRGIVMKCPRIPRAIAARQVKNT